MSKPGDRALSPTAVMRAHDALYQAEMTEAEDQRLQDRLVSMCLMAAAAKRNKAQGGVDAPHEEEVTQSATVAEHWAQNRG